MLSKNQVKLVRSLELKKNRKHEGLFVAEGPKVVGDLLRSGWKARYLFSTVERPDAQIVTDDELRRISFLQHPQEVLAVFEIPTRPLPRGGGIQQPPSSFPTSPRKGAGVAYGSGLSLALDGIQDPGNLGTIIRIADWFGITAIYCSPDTADAYNPKVVQATMGSLAHVHIIYTDLVQLLDSLPVGYPVYGTLLDGDDIYGQELSNEGIIIMGNEGNGLSPAVRQRVNRRLLIPDFHVGGYRAESLNVAIATAITCSEFRRRDRLR